ncbi:MAG: hypothetical protein R2795_25725, partial [Saprospiraceae bacterium]
YAPLLDKKSWGILPVQVKHNLLYSDLARYAPLLPHAHFIAYGINAGGLKLDSNAYTSQASLTTRGGNPIAHAALIAALRQRVEDWQRDATERPSPSTMNHLSMIYAVCHSNINALLIGPSRIAQLEDSLLWASNLAQYDYSDVYTQLTITGQQYAATR